MSTFFSDDAGSLLNHSFSQLFFPLLTDPQMRTCLSECSEEEVTPPLKGYVIDLLKLYPHLVMTASSRTPPPITSHSLHIAEFLALWSLYHFIYLLKQGLRPSCIF